jgi:hypothetical protein
MTAVRSFWVQSHGNIFRDLDITIFQQEIYKHGKLTG